MFCYFFEQVIVLPAEWIMIEGENSIGCDFVDFLYCFFCIYCGCLVTPPYNGCCRYKFYPAASMRIGISLVEWIVLIVIGIFIDNGTIANKTSYLFEMDHCLLFLIGSLSFYVIYTYFPYLMPDLRLPTDIAIRSMWGYSFLGEITELDRLNDLLEKQYKKNPILSSNFECVWDTPAKDKVFLRQCGLNRELVNVLSSLGFHSVKLLEMTLKDDEIDPLYHQIQHWYPNLEISRSKFQRCLENFQSKVNSNPSDKNNCNHKLPAIFALANKQYETLKWLESKGAKQHIWLFKNRNTYDKQIYQTMGFEWARKLLSACQNEAYHF